MEEGGGGGSETARQSELRFQASPYYNNKYALAIYQLTYMYIYTNNHRETEIELLKNVK